MPPIISYSNVRDGRKVVASAGTRERLVSGNTPCKMVLITAEIDNTSEVTLGDVTVVGALGATRRGTPLIAGQSVQMNIEDLYMLYIDAITSGDGVSFTYYF